MAKKKSTTRKKKQSESRGSKSTASKRSSSKTNSKKDKPRAKKKRATKTADAAVAVAGSEAEEGRHDECVVVGIGASAGGLEAYKHFLREMPVDSGVALVLVQHLDPTHESLMVELLSKYTSMPVLQVKDATSIEPNHVYMIPPNRFIKIADGGLFLDEPVAKRGVRLPIDYFFRSLSEARKERAICVVLSGTGSDGADGVREVKAAGGMTIVQNPETAEYDGMPRAAISTGCVDFVLPIEEMAGAIVPYAKHPYVQSVPNTTLADAAPDHYRAILGLLRAYTDQDFSRYKKGTLTRRIERRMGLKQIDQPADYLKLLREKNEELQALFKDLLIGVTSFFRDDAAWEEMADVLSTSIAEKPEQEPFRVWVPGCSTGEEAYSAAILLYEQQQQNRRLDLQVFATDIDRDAIEVARSGLYPVNVTKDLPEEILEAYFQREGDRLRVRKKLRETCIFAVQNVLSDPPFSGLDLICCRNLLIYLESDVQRRVFDMLHFALRPGGLLFLGTSESPSNRKHLFKAVSQSSRIYRKIGQSKAAGAFPVAGPVTRRAARDENDRDDGPAVSVGTAELSKRALLDEFAPASVVVNRRGLIQYIHGPVRNYLDFPSGEPDLEIAAMAQEGLKAKTRSALQQARSTGQPVSHLAPRVRRHGGVVSVRLKVQPLPAGKDADALFLVSFLDEGTTSPRLPEDAEASSGADCAVADETDRQLALELQATREDLQSTIEELESANEELKASNEEVMSMNEELQSSNEELETSREELQSLNEELSTVNSQLHDKVDELEGTTNDLQNLLTSTDVATIFLDEKLRIRRFTPATSRLINMLETDIGRSVSDLSPRIQDPKLVKDARAVLDQLTPIEREVKSDGEKWFIRRIMPFRTSENRIAGLVVTFTDITSVKHASNQLAYREAQQAVIAKLGRAALATNDLQEFLDRVVGDVAERLGVKYAKVLRLMPGGKKLLMLAGVGWKKGLVGKGTVPAGVHSQAGYTLQSEGPIIVEHIDTEKRFGPPKLLTDHDVVSGMSVVIGPEQRPWGVLGVHADVEHKFTLDDTNFIQAVANLVWEAVQREGNERRFRALVSASANIVWTTNAAGEVVEDSPSWRSFTGQTYEQWKGWGWLDAVHPDDQHRTATAWRNAIESESPLTVEHRVRQGDNGWRWMEVRAVPLTEFDGTVRGWVGMNVDISEHKESELRLLHQAEIVESSRDAIIGKTLDGTITSWNPAAEFLYGYTAEEMIGQSSSRLIPDDRPNELAEILEKLTSGEAIHHHETMRRCKDGSMRDVSLTISPIRDPFGTIIGASAIARDVTEQKILEWSLEEARRAAEVANEAKSVFLANMSHEIRTPMTAILGYADVLIAQLDDSDAQACVRTIKENGAYLCDIINDILDLSKIESGKMTVRSESTSLIKLLADVRSLMNVRATEKSLTLSVAFDGEVPDPVVTDSKLVRQVLVNLIANAIKFTERGGVQVWCKCIKRDQLIEISVKDTGIGIAEEDMKNLFLPFEQLDDSFTRTAGGSGLGLAISKKLVEMLGGELTVESERGKGSTFRFTFATGSLTQSEWTEPEAADLQRLSDGIEQAPLPTLDGRILAADDRREIRFLVQAFLESAGAELELVNNGEEALEAYQRSVAEGRPFDAILLDMQMPVVDGLDAARTLRAEGFRVPLIALTANAMSGDRDKCLDAGCDDVVTKPIDRQELVETIARRLEQDDADESPATGLTILCVDDSEDTGRLQKMLLERMGHQVATAKSGHEAMEILNEMTPDVVILDLGLPEMSGDELLSQLKVMPALARCKFACLTGRGEDEVDWQTMGFDCYLQKPADISEIDRIVRLIAR